jgi:hypothetical protein
MGTELLLERGEVIGGKGGFEFGYGLGNDFFEFVAFHYYVSI